MKKGFIERGGLLLAYILLAFVGLVGLALFWAGEAHAQTACPTGAVANDAARVCWTNATENVDGSPIPATGDNALRETRVRRSLCNADGTPGTAVETISVPPNIGVVLFSGLPPARHCFQAQHVNNLSESSAWSAPARKTTTAPAPPKPRQPNVTVS